MTSLLDYRADKPVDMIQPVNKLHPLNRGLVSWWLALPGTMGGARLMDIVNPGPNGNHGTLTNMNPQTDWVGSNRLGSWGALDFDGSNDYVNVPHRADLNIRTDITLAAWVNINTLGAFDTFLNKGDLGGAGNVTYGFQKKNTDVFTFFHTIGDTGQFTNSITTLDADTWYHLVATVDAADECRLYLDGVEDVNGNVGSRPSNTTILTVGARDLGATQNWPGLIDDVRINNRALSANEVAWLYQLSQQGYPGLLNRIGPFWLVGGAAVAQTVTPSPIAVILVMTVPTVIYTMPEPPLVSPGAPTLHSPAEPRLKC